MQIKLALWSCILNLFVIHPALTKRGSGCSSLHGGCGRPKSMQVSAAGRWSHQSKSQHPRYSVKSAHFGRSSTLSNATLAHSAKDNLYMKKQAVEALAKDIIVALIMKEGAIGIHLIEHNNATKEGLETMENLTTTWTQTPPTVDTFLESVSFVLDNLKVGSAFITDDMVRIRKVEIDPKHPITKVIRSNYKYNHIEDAYLAKDLRDGLDEGRYKLNNELGTTKVLQTANNGTDETCQPYCYNRIEGSDWWGPIIRVREHLKYSDLWMVFLEELNSKLESIESQIEPRQMNFKGEFSRWEGGEHIHAGNIMEALDRMNKEYNLYSIKNRIAEIVATVNDNRLQYLNEIVRITLKTKPLCSMKSDIAYVAAPYLLMSQVLNCTRYLTMIDSKINVVAVIASAKFYIDDDLQASLIRSPKLELGRGFHVVIVSPEWLVVGGNKRTIDLSGRTPPTFSSTTEDWRGGEPGLPGEEGGRLFSIGSYISGGNIMIKLNGGNGGDGQNAGYHVTFNRYGCYPQYLYVGKGHFCCNIWQVQFWIPGLHGGKSGIGAPAGSYQTFVFNNDSQQKFYSEQNPGKTGKIGKGTAYYSYPWTWYNSHYVDISGIKQYNNHWCSQKGYQVSTLPLNKQDHDYMSGGDGQGYRNPSQPTKISFEAKMSVSAILRYKILSRKHSHLLNALKIHDFVSKLDLDDTINDLYSTIDLINEFNALGKEASGAYFNKEILKLSYQSLAKRALARAKNYNGDNKDDHVRVLLFLSSAARSKMLAVANPYEPILVVNMEVFLAVEKSRVVDLKRAVEEQLQYEHITKAVSNYNAMIQKHFEEAGYFIDTTINPEFDAIEMKMGQFTQALLDKIKELKKDEEKNKELLKKHREQLKSHRTGNLVSGILKTIGDAINVFHPIGGAISAGVDLGNSIANPDPGRPPVTTVPIPEAVSTGSKNSALRFRQSTSYSLTGFKRQLEAVKMTVSPHRETFENTLRVLESISTEKLLKDGDDATKPIDDFPPADCVLSFKHKRTTEATIKELQIKVSEAVKLDKSNAEKSRKISDIIKKAAEVATAVIGGVASTYNQWQQDTDSIEEISEAIKNTDQNIMALQNHINRIEMEMLPAMDALFKGLSDARQDLASQSSIALIVIRHKMQAAIRDAQTDFKNEYVKGTGLEDYFQRGLQSLEDAMGALITIYERLDTYKEQGKLANFTAEVALHPTQYLEKLKDTSLQKKFDELRYTLQGEILLKRQSLVEGAYRMWKFPMVDPVLCEYKNLSASTQNFSTHEEVLKFLTSVEKRIDNLIEIVRISKSSIVPGDKYTIKAEFNRDPESYPFYKWTNKSSSEFVASMLRGRPTFLHSDPIPGPPFCEAVKFSKILLTFGSVSGDIELEQKLNTILKKYTVTLTHGGNSNYRFANQTFVLSAEKIDLDFSFELNSDGIPKLRNNVYDKLLKGDLTLSPYATWGIVMQPINPGVGFQPLETFSYKLDVYLEGFGSCVRKTFAVEGDYVSPTCDDIQLAKFYPTSSLSTSNMTVLENTFVPRNVGIAINA